MYNKDFYARCVSKYGEFAKEVIPVLIEQLNPKSVVDIGCGAGMYIKSFYDQGVDVVGYEGNTEAKTYGLLPEKVIIHDVREKLTFDRKFDLCMCVEVAEHIPDSKALELLNTLCSASDSILFTAAKIGQSGSDHINCQNEEYWINKFKELNYVFDQSVRDSIKQQIKTLPSFQPDSNFFYRNLMIFKKTN